MADLPSRGGPPNYVPPTLPTSEHPTLLGLFGVAQKPVEPSSGHPSSSQHLAPLNYSATPAVTGTADPMSGFANALFEGFYSASAGVLTAPSARTTTELPTLTAVADPLNLLGNHRG